MLRQDGREVIDVQAVAQAGVLLRALHNGNVPVTVVVARNRAVQHTKGFYLPAAETDNLVAVLGFAPVSVVHAVFPPSHLGDNLLGDSQSIALELFVILGLRTKARLDEILPTHVNSASFAV